jgi:hypothetical protein
MSATADHLAEVLGMPKLTLACFAEALIIERAYTEAAEELGTGWPAGCCVEASIDLRDVLDTTLPTAGAEFVFGKFALHPPTFQWDHAWVRLGDGTIIDLTAGQYVPGSGNLGSCIVVKPGDPVAACYIETERDPEWARQPDHEES